MFAEIFAIIKQFSENDGFFYFKAYMDIRQTKPWQTPRGRARKAATSCPSSIIPPELVPLPGGCFPLILKQQCPTGMDVKRLH